MKTTAFFSLSTPSVCCSWKSSLCAREGKEFFNMHYLQRRDVRGTTTCGCSCMAAVHTMAWEGFHIPATMGKNDIWKNAISYMATWNVTVARDQENKRGKNPSSVGCSTAQKFSSNETKTNESLRMTFSCSLTPSNQPTARINFTAGAR